MVERVATANGQTVVKLSDNMEEAPGDPKTIDRMKRLTGYAAIFYEVCRTSWHEPNCCSSLCRESRVVNIVGMKGRTPHREGGRGASSGLLGLRMRRELSSYFGSEKR